MHSTSAGTTSPLSVAVVFAACLLGAPDSVAQVTKHEENVERSKTMVPSPPWPAGDERGMANTIGQGTWLRCAYHLAHTNAKVYEISHARSNSMPMSPFGVPLNFKHRPTAVLPGTIHAYNGEELITGEPGAQGTQMDAFGHFGVLREAWDGKEPAPVDGTTYYGGFTQHEVKPSPDSPLLKLGIDKVPPIVTSAVLLDAKTYLGKGKPLRPGQIINANDIEMMIAAQGLAWRGLLPGDVLYIYTGWSDNWEDPDHRKTYYTMGPGLSPDAAKFLETKRIVLVALDNPFTDPVSEGQLPNAGGSEQTPAGAPWYIHHYNLTQAGILQIQNANLEPLASDKIWTACTIILPLRSRGHAGSPVRPIAIGAPSPN